MNFQFLHIIFNTSQIQGVRSHFRIQSVYTQCTHDFQHITKNCQTQCSLRRVENHTEEINDGNMMMEKKYLIDAY